MTSVVLVVCGLLLSVIPWLRGHNLLCDRQRVGPSVKPFMCTVYVGHKTLGKFVHMAHGRYLPVRTAALEVANDKSQVGDNCWS